MQRNLRAKILLSAVLGSALLLLWGMTLWSLMGSDYSAPDLVKFLGRLHPAVLHLPIGLTFLLLLTEGVMLVPEKVQNQLRISKLNENNLNWLLTLTLFTTAMTVIHGILLFVSDGYTESTLARRHMIGGMAFYSSLSAVAFLKIWVQSQKAKTLTGSIGVVVSFLILIISAHDGASLTHGENYLSQYAPKFGKSSGQSDKRPSALAEEFTKRNVYEVAIQPVFDLTCVQCHKETKKKGKLRMDSFDEVLKGGASGEMFVAYDLENSLFLERIRLPMDDDEHMPPSGKTQPSAEHIKILKWWILAGAPHTGSFASHNPPEQIYNAVQSLSSTKED